MPASRRFAWIILLLAIVASTTARAQERVTVQIRKADVMRPLKVGDRNIHRLIGNVELEHDGVVMSCDSAYMYTESNTFDAYGHVVISSDESIMYGDSLFYEGDVSRGRMVGNLVEMHSYQEDFSLWTRALHFNSEAKTASYFSGGTIRSEDTRIWSLRGTYFSKTRSLQLAKTVKLQTDSVAIYGDSILYNTQYKIVTFAGETRVYQDSMRLYALKGVYHRMTEFFELLAPFVMGNGKYFLFGDWLQYDRRKGFANAKKRVVAQDRKASNRIYANHLTYYEQGERIEATEEPCAFSIDTTSMEARDTLYARADTMRMWAIPTERPGDSINPPRLDTIRYARMRGDIRGFSVNSQFVADSIYYNGEDSLAYIYRKGNPYLWNDSSQLTAEKMQLHIANGGVDWAYGEGKVYVGRPDDSTNYNQVYGQKMRATIREGQLRRVKVEVDAEVIFYMRDNGRLVGLNHATAPVLEAIFKEGVVDEVTFFQAAVSDVLPIKDLTNEDRNIPGFAWREDLRPQNSAEIIPPWIPSPDFHLPRLQKADDYAIKDAKIPPVVIPSTGRGAFSPRFL